MPLSLDDPRWNNLKGGYKAPFDPRPLLVKLGAQNEVDTVWDELWTEVHHQGDVGEASYAVVPQLVNLHRERGLESWNAYAMVAIIELARERPGNPKVPEWLEEDYFAAIQELAQIGASELLRAKDSDEIRAILSVLAIAKGQREHGKLLIEYSGDELLDLERLRDFG